MSAHVVARLAGMSNYLTRLAPGGSDIFTTTKCTTYSCQMPWVTEFHKIALVCKIKDPVEDHIVYLSFMAKPIIYILLSILFSSSLYAQESIQPDRETDFPSIGEQSDGLQPVPPIKPASVEIPAVAKPDVPKPSSGSSKGQLQFTPIPPVPELKFSTIPSPVIPPFTDIPSPATPHIPDIPSPELKFTKFSDFSETPETGISAPTETQNLPGQAPARNIILRRLPLTAAGGGGSEAGGGKAYISNGGSSTPTPVFLTPPVWGLSSTPIASPLQPATISPYVWGLSSTPIASPLAPNIVPLNPQTPYTWGLSSTPIAAPVPLNTVAPYTWGLSSTPIASPVNPYSWGPSSTPTGLSSTPRGQSSTPQGQSSTPHGQSSTPQGQSSTPRGESSTPRAR